MIQIYIDTNVFLDFYQSATDRLEVFQELQARATTILLTQQTVEEFQRNRVTRLVELAKNIEKTASLQIFTSAVVRELPAFSELIKLRDSALAVSRKITDELRSWATNEDSDIVLLEFNKLAVAASCLPTTSESIGRAHQRKLLGRPPTSPDKHTIGNELIWETILAGAKSDLIVVSRDKAFLDNAALLKREFEVIDYRKLILVTPKLSEALAGAGQPSEKVKAAEDSIRAEPREAHLHTKCSKCGGYLEETGYEGSDGDSAWWLYCPRCGHEVFP